MGSLEECDCPLVVGKIEDKHLLITIFIHSCAKERYHISNINKNFTLAITNWKFNMIVPE